LTTRGILHPSAVGRLFSLDRRPPPPDLAPLIDSHWIVSWDLRGRAPYDSEVLPHPSVHLVFEPGGVAVYGIQRRRYVRHLDGAGWAIGTKFAPGGFAPFIDRPVSDLTDRVVPGADVFGPELAGVAADGDGDPDAVLPGLHELLRSRVAAAPDRRIALVQALVADIHSAPPDDPVAAVAGRHHVSVRTVQRLFAAYVGIGPKWVMQRYRLHEAIERLDRRRRQDWTRFALDLGYYDHAHFLRDFGSLLGRTPAQYESETLDG
jgi:AraC-like DNA-binding protein